MLESFKYTRGSLYVLDQLLLPFETKYVHVTNSQDGFRVIRNMQVRGAPLIAIVAVLSLAVELVSVQLENDASAKRYIEVQLMELKKSRPTAVNLTLAINEIIQSIELVENPVEAYLEYAEGMLRKDVSDNKSLGKFGANYLRSEFNRPLKVLTHCNTGSLATCGWGTALGIIRDLHQSGHINHAFCTETRPYNQGSRLTAYELVFEKIPSSLVCDSMVSLLIQKEQIDCIIIGADRVAKNGDTCNKIGSLQLAIIANYYNIPFIVAAPRTSIDLKTASGSEIEIEHRSGEEVLSLKGLLNEKIVEVEVGARGINVWNPAFDVVPSQLITAIVTEKGVILKRDGISEFDMEVHCI